MPRDRVIGIDGGGTRSEACLWEDGVLRERARGGALNPNRAGEAASRAALAGLLSDLCMAYSGTSGSLWTGAACVGLSGVSHPSTRRIVQEAFQTAGIRVDGPRILVSDAEIVLEAAWGGAAPSGVVLIAGTGSMAAARDATGALRRAGGLGPARDEGGGAWIEAQSGEPPERVAARARAGDPAARALLVRAARELAALVSDVATAARLTAPVAVRPAGGLAVHVPELIAAVADELARALPGAVMGPVVADPVTGAFALATRLRAAGGDVPPGW